MVRIGFINLHTPNLISLVWLVDALTIISEMNPKWLGSGDTSVKILKNIING